MATEHVDFVGCLKMGYSLHHFFMRYSDEVIGIEETVSPIFVQTKPREKAVKDREAIGIYGRFTIGTLG